MRAYRFQRWQHWSRLNPKLSKWSVIMILQQITLDNIGRFNSWHPVTISAGHSFAFQPLSHPQCFPKSGTKSITESSRNSEWSSWAQPRDIIANQRMKQDCLAGRKIGNPLQSFRLCLDIKACRDSHIQNLFYEMMAKDAIQLTSVKIGSLLRIRNKSTSIWSSWCKPHQPGNQPIRCMCSPETPSRLPLNPEPLEP